MADIRHQKLAKVLVYYSLRLKPGDKFIISGPDFAAPLIREVYREAVRAGANTETYITIDGLEEILLREGKVYADGQLCYENGKFII
jgi:aminopeptidase